MSSAAVQSSSAPLSNRQYQSRDQYYSQQSPSVASNTSPASSRKPAPRSAGNGASPHTPQQPSTQSPVESSGSSLTPRAQPLPPSTDASPLVTSSSAGPPISPPQRTSSTQKSNTTTAPTMEQQMGQLPLDAQGARRQQSSRDGPRSVSSSTKTKQSPSHSRSANAVGQPPMGTDLPREESTIMNRIVVADPQEDVARERARIAESQPMQLGSDVTPITGLGLVGSEGVDDGGRGAGKAQDKGGKQRKEMKFGDYVLGQTLGEGEFGKVKMGWKRDGGVQVAIKLIRKENLQTNPSRLPKIYREINILRDLQHPNIVRLHEMVETQRHIGIILEYASGGELFDYILNHRYLKDHAARRLFAQLVSGVGYLHKKGIVHRDLKLENLLLDRNRNIIITDFGFANTFNPNDELGEEIEYRLNDKDYIKKSGLDRTLEDGHRRGDLMQTSCGSPCYAAPELVVSDTLYTGRKVDVWSCGVILYAMLAGYLPFDDDPANPEGDNINLLYKYIVSTPLTFPEYVTPHARDLLKRILVPDPRKRADLFEVARHSWLSEYAHVVEFITSSTTTQSDIANTAFNNDDPYDNGPKLGRSASVREPSKSHMPPSNVGLQKSQVQVDDPAADRAKGRDNKRRTVQVEYVAPQSSTARGEAPPPRAPPVQTSMPPPARPVREAVRAASDSTAFAGAAPAPAISTSRPTTGGSMTANRLPSRGNSYSQPSTAAVAATNAQGRFSQPKGTPYTITTPTQSQTTDFGRLSTQRLPATYQQETPDPRYNHPNRTHKRSSTLSGITDKILGRTGSVKGNRPSHDPASGARTGKPGKSYPPTSMKQALPQDDGRRGSSDSRRTSFSFGRKNTDDSNGAFPKEKRNSRRFSLFKGFGKRDDEPPTPRSASAGQQAPRTGGMAFGQGTSRSPSQSTTATQSTIPVLYDSALDRRRGVPGAQAAEQQQDLQYSGQYYDGPQDYYRTTSNTATATTNDQAVRQQRDEGKYEKPLPFAPQYPSGFDPSEQDNGLPSGSSGKLQKPHRRFNDAYEDGGHSGTSAAAKRVMDLFRRRGKSREGGSA
ncbi:kinase-like protein [Rhizodiscina lignyota]|uniref:non-specific serine/threonine protein kinase n=1 Tax=Rhizodiscina lignyota TaxID=1504668 RepID=A0A9P4IFX6_9PEZI|nr:kinase-like protein [Rhizodiscina lignyota]